MIGCEVCASRAWTTGVLADRMAVVAMLRGVFDTALI